MHKIGTDIVEIGRFEKLIRNPRFLDRVYTKKEQKYLAAHGNCMAESAAGLFCAKEAVAKALGTGIAYTLNWNDIEISRAAGNAPRARVHGIETLPIALSIAHCHSYATATALILE